MPLWFGIIAAYLLASVISAILLAVDKRAARLHRRRISESTLHTVELLGGWPGSMFTRGFLRHKTRKRSYRARFWLIVALHLAAWIAWAVWHLRRS